MSSLPPIKYYSSELFLCEISTALGAIICPRVIVVELVDGSIFTYRIASDNKGETATIHTSGNKPLITCAETELRRSEDIIKSPANPSIVAVIHTEFKWSKIV